MVNTWTTSYFQTDGVRALFVLPQSWTDAFIPMTVTPKPKQIVRVMVGRLELLTAERERLAENAVRDLASGDSGKRQQAFRFLHEQGRYVEPIVRRVMKTTNERRRADALPAIASDRFRDRAARGRPQFGGRQEAHRRSGPAPRPPGPAAPRNRLP